MSDLYIARGSRLAARRVAGEVVILSADDSSLYVLNELGGLLWDAADGRTPLQQIVRDVVCRQFEVDAPTGYRDAEAFARELAGFGLMELSASPLDGQIGPPDEEPRRHG